jgi:acyl dehydratase
MAVSLGVEAGEPMRFGDRIHSRWYLLEERPARTKVGDGAFFTFEVQVSNQDGRLVATERTVVLSFTPRPASTRSLAPTTTPLIAVPGEPFDPAAPALGQVLTGFALPLTLQRLTMIAAANRDFAPIHHDPAAAAEIGAQAPVANSMVLLSIIERLMLEHGGSRAIPVRLGPIRLVRPAAATGTLTCDGRVRAVRAREGEVEIDVRVAVDRAVCAEGTASFRIRDRT